MIDNSFGCIVMLVPTTVAMHLTGRASVSSAAILMTIKTGTLGHRFSIPLPLTTQSTEMGINELRSVISQLLVPKIEDTNLTDEDVMQYGKKFTQTQILGS